MTPFYEQHRALFWGEHTTPPLFVHTLTPTFDALAQHTITQIAIPKVSVICSVIKNCLQLSFIIQKTPWLTLPPFVPSHLKHTDFLWQDNCLECFVEFNHHQSYSEINFSPNGNYAIYHFDDYRTPNCMPPKQGEGTIFVPDGNFDDAKHWVRHLAIQFSHFQTLSKLHPTAILYYDGTPIYYAITHATPPDFHHKAYWQPWSTHAFDN